MFESKTDPIPPLRYDIQVIPVEQQGKKYLHFFDRLGYATEGFAIPAEMEGLLSLIDGSRSVEGLLKYLDEGTSSDELLRYIQFLDQQAILDSEHFAETALRVEEEYESAGEHHSNTAGLSYPDDPGQISAFLEDAFEGTGNAEQDPNIKALYAPHIDPRVGMKSYVKAFSKIRHLNPKRVIILGTSHYAGMYGDLYDNHPFIVSEKDHIMPNGRNQADKAFIRSLRDTSDHDKLGLSFADRALRIEHSIELHLLYLNHIWEHDFQIVPILVGGFDDLFYMDDSYKAGVIDRFGAKLREMTENDPDTFFLISGDLAHFGRKFGDTKSANEMYEEVEAFDEAFLTHAEKNDPAGILDLIRKEHDPYRICGFPPLYSFLKTFDKLEGEVISYDLWDERERESAVSFGSIIFR